MYDKTRVYRERRSSDEIGSAGLTTTSASDFPEGAGKHTKFEIADRHASDAGKTVRSHGATGSLSHAQGKTRPRRVAFLGLRGIPNVQGGVEKHVEMLASEMVKQGWDVEVVGRKRYLPKHPAKRWNGVRILSVWSPKSMSLEALVHTFIGVGLCALRRPDIVHIHALGPSLAVPFARIAGLKTVVTHHGYDYDRQKWGGFAKKVLKLGERLGMRFSNGRIAVSKNVTRTMESRYGVPVSYIPNGVLTQPHKAATGILDTFGLMGSKYIILAARFVPEKRQLDLINAYASLRGTSCKLVLAGAAEFESPYSREVKALADKTPGVVLAGFQTGDELAELFARAALFVLPSSHEGLPIALLEAMAFGIPVLASDIEPHLELELPKDHYFPLGDINALATAISSKIESPPTPDELQARVQSVQSIYNWSDVAARTLCVYETVLGKR